MRRVILAILCTLCVDALADSPLVTRHSSLVTGGSGAAASPYGACAHLPRDEFGQREGILSLMRVAGISNVRCDLDWAAWEKDNAYPRFAEVLDTAEREGVTVLPILGGSSPRRVLPFEEHQDEFLAAFHPYVADVMRRFGARLPAFEVWNEPNLPGWWNLPNPTNYLAVLKAAHDEIKAANPDALVCLGGVSDIGLGYIRALYELGTAPYFDVVCCHPYTIPLAPEGTLDVKIEKLRALMAEFGDAEKPIWITEVGFPTHRNGVGTVETQVLLSGLRIARPEQRTWRVACASIAPEGKTPPQDFAGELLAVLPQGSTAVCYAPDELREKLAADAFDAVVFPMDGEGYPVAAIGAVTDFVRRGGVLVETGGAPLYFPYLCDAGGNVSEDKTRDPAADRRALRLGFSAWWLDPDLPTRTEVFATPQALEAGFKPHPAGYGGTRFLTPEFLRPGDEFIPILSGKSKSGKEIAAAAVFKFGSDFKGALVVCGTQKGYGPIAHSERQQALYLARSILVALAEGVDKFYAYELRATEADPYHSESHFGIVHRNLAPKPAYGAYAALTNRRPAGSVQKPGPWRDKERKLYFPQWTRPDGAAAGAIWTTGEPQRLEFEFDSDGVTFMDAFGLPLPLRRTGPKRFSIDISDAPIYFTGGRFLCSYGDLHRSCRLGRIKSMENTPTNAMFAAASRPGPLNVLDFGAIGDGVHDDTAAFQSAIDAIAARGGGKIVVPYSPKGYRIAGPGREFVEGRPCRGQLVIPPVKGLNVAFEGEMPCKLLYSYQVRPPESVKSGFTPTRFGTMGMPNTCLFSDWTPPEERDPAARPWTILATVEGDSCRGRFSVAQVSIANLEFRAHLDKEAMYPKGGCVNLQNAARAIVRDSQFCLDDNVGDTILGKSLQPNPCHTVGLMMSGDQNDNQVLNNVAVQGFRHGFVLGEHVVADYLYVHNCEEGIVFHDASHLSVINHVVAQHNRVILATAPDGLFGHGAGPCNVMVGSVDMEPGRGLLPKVSELVAGVSDPGNRLRGSLVWHPGWGGGDFPVVGAANFRVERFAESSGSR